MNDYSFLKDLSLDEIYNVLGSEEVVLKLLIKHLGVKECLYRMTEVDDQPVRDVLEEIISEGDYFDFDNK